jgi:predicted nuclease with RNAse H fold
MPSFIVLGVDLAGVAHRPTGMCVLKGMNASTFISHSDDEILECVEREKPDLIAVDAPLHLPPGRKSIEDRNGAHFRVCDIELRQRKIPFFPITLGPMRMLTVRGMALKQKLGKRGFRVVEMYPGGAQDVWGIPRARRDKDGLRAGLQRLGMKGLEKDLSDHELDAATGALVGLHFLQDKAEVLGNFRDGAILMPKPQ